MLVGIPFGGIKPAKNSLFLYLALILTPSERKKKIPRNFKLQV
jgi:hypothetical protein